MVLALADLRCSTEGASTAITIGREQRDAIYEEVLTDVSGSGDVWAEMQSGDYGAARRTRDRLVGDMRLLDDIGWEPEPGRELFELTMDGPDLARVLRTLHENAGSTVHEQVTRPLEEAELAQRSLVTQTTCGDLLARIAAGGGIALRLRAHLADQPDHDPRALVFTNEAGGVIDPNNLRRRVLKPLVEEVNAPWAAFHTFRHTFASLHLSRGTNLLQLSRALGHHSAAFTLTRYTHLLPGDEAPALDLVATTLGSSEEARA